MYKSIALLTLAAFSVVEAGLSPQIVRRQFRELTCAESGLKDCGDGCIYLSDICCPSGGGCMPGTYCDGDGCCPIGKTCTGGGGIITIPGQIIDTTSTKTFNVPVPTFTQTVGRPQVTTSSTVDDTEIETPSSRPTPNRTPILSLASSSTRTSTTSTSTAPTVPINGTGVPTARPSAPLFPGAADRNVFNTFLALIPFLFI